MTYGLMISASMLGYFLMKPKIAVIGESCIDEYVYGTCDRVCPEAAALCFHHKNISPALSGKINSILVFALLSKNFIISLSCC